MATPVDIPAAAGEMLSWANECEQESHSGLALAIGSMAALLHLVSDPPEDQPAPEPNEAIEQCYILLSEFDDTQKSDHWAKDVVREIHRQWGSCLEVTGHDLTIPGEETETWTTSWSSEYGDPKVEEAVAEPAVPTQQLREFLEALGGDADPPSDRVSSATAESLKYDSTKGDGETLVDRSLLPAFLDDAVQCLEAMENAMDDLRGDGDHAESLRQFCRQLHTLKGASGTVGLMSLSRFLHQLEDQIEELESRAGRDNLPLLGSGVDAVRKKLRDLGAEETGSSSEGISASSSVSRESGSQRSRNPEPERFVRIESSRVEHLLDLLAELVMLRSRRETNLQELRQLKLELDRSVERTRSLSTFLDQTAETAPTWESDNLATPNQFTDNHASEEAARFHATVELANDLTSLSHSLRQALVPIENDNLAVARLTSQFRRDLMDLRRLPMGGLFRRLEKAALEAARAEGRDVTVEFRGQGTRAERALQDQLFEPLMHLIRNAVSHGIESADERKGSGKPARGRVILEAVSTPSGLQIEVRDDGRGLNEQAIEKKAKQQGLLPLGSKPQPRELWNLIFHPGFSTRNQVSEISGRGVGMDVVAAQIRQMRGQVLVNSRPGEGTVFTLNIPLRSPIEHALVVRAGGQCFALPMKSVFGLNTTEHDQNSVEKEDQPVSLRRVLRLTKGRRGPGQSIFLANPESCNRLEITVDEVVGVEEVVVRSLPRMLAQHDLFTGVSLSGNAEIVLLLDPVRLARLIVEGDYQSPISDADDLSPLSDAVFGAETATDEPSKGMSETLLESQLNEPSVLRDRNAAGLPGDSGAPHAGDPILVVDDSLSVRQHLVRKLAGLGFESREAGDGQEALEMLRRERFRAVITDVDMPRMNGTVLLAEISHRAAWRNLPIFVVTSRTDRVLQDQLKKLGARAVFTKPVTDSNCGEILQQITDHSPPQVLSPAKRDV
ncbi:MAG: response regulator [Planctomycetaceae bacterium]|nr:response regulator [Planctomycetaceae bacterium]